MCVYVYVYLYVCVCVCVCVIMDSLSCTIEFDVPKFLFDLT
jgi:hypothetical protein